ncbi:hypothetical protein T440DRAFT_132866 [Plenodomus tracheiphilus IPT5]|uniref:Uncharacterized protein n=1 Tax=Plenodomus tracheiphilus IPT5 TaxID=1408161 RepID=A0A6A7B193_9PLEO|nr:hypothetical protein T440DRAFT_132866 [Plenodomus tracheiphilus IPT5]
MSSEGVSIMTPYVILTFSEHTLHRITIMPRARKDTSTAANAPQLHSDYIDMSHLFGSDIIVDDIFFAAPAEGITLSESARNTLHKLKTRCAWHLQWLRDEWRHDIQMMKFDSAVEDKDKDSVQRDAGVLIMLPREYARHYLNIVHLKNEEELEEKLKTLGMDDMVALIRKLRSKSDKYVDEVERLWYAMDIRKKRADAWDRFYKDMGLLLQTPVPQAKEIFRILIEGIKAGKIVKGENCRYFEREAAPLPRRVEERDASREPSFSIANTLC